MNLDKIIDEIYANSIIDPLTDLASGGEDAQGKAGRPRKGRERLTATTTRLTRVPSRGKIRGRKS